jgi:hypothetical protein
MRKFYLLLLVLLSGCASVLSGETQDLQVNVTCGGFSFPSMCVVHNGVGRWEFHTPERKKILRDSTPITVVCKSGSVGEYGVIQLPKINPIILGNFFSGGLIGISVDSTMNSLWMYSDISIEHKFCRGY